MTDQTTAAAGPVDRPLGPLGERKSEIRIEWGLEGAHGGGYWRLETPHSVSDLRSHVAELCAKYGPGTHWIAVRDA